MPWGAVASGLGNLWFNISAFAARRQQLSSLRWLAQRHYYAGNCTECFLQRATLRQKVRFNMLLDTIFKFSLEISQSHS